MIELALSISVLIIIGTVSLASFVSSRNVRDLTSSGNQTLSLLKLAQSRTLAGQNDANWGVHFEQGQAVLFRGPTYAGSPSTEPFLLPSNIEIVNINLLGGGADVLFNRITGDTSQSGTLDLRVRSATGIVFSITIDPSGKVFQTGTAPAAGGSRVVDTRHRTFDLTGSIRNSTTMTLRFSDSPNPDTVQNITMTPTAPRSTFEWEGAYTVGGQQQTLRIHALSITDTDTLLSVDRDCRKNTKQVKISFDGADVVTYNADCRTLAMFPFGGVATEP